MATGTILTPLPTMARSNPQIVRTRGVNPSMVGRACPFPKSDDLRPIGISMISSMTTKEEGMTFLQIFVLIFP